MSTYKLPDNKIPDHLRNVVDTIQEILVEEALDFLLIGATARDIIMHGQYDLESARKTLDVDFAIYVPEWSVYQKVMKKLIESGKFEETKVAHKLLFKGAEVDIVPFGNIQDENGEYAWPPDFMIAMNVAGFNEIHDKGITLESEDGKFKLRIAPIEGIAIMKVFAWKDRKHRTQKDGEDIGFIIANYVELKYDVLYEKYEDIIEAQDWDTTVSGARILGRDMGEIIKSNPVATTKLIEILKKELKDEDNSNMAKVMSKSTAGYPKAYKALESLLQGIWDITG